MRPDSQLRQKVIHDAQALMRKVELEAYASGALDKKKHSISGRPFGIEAAVVDYIEGGNRPSFIELVSKMLRMREKPRAAGPARRPPCAKEPLGEGIIRD